MSEESLYLPSNPEQNLSEQTLELDEDVLNSLTNRAAVPGAAFGRELVLTEQDRTQLLLVTDKVDAILAQKYAQPEWQAFEALHKEGTDKGVLSAYGNHPNTNVPLWCVDSGSEGQVGKTRTAAGKPGIEVPSDVYWTFHWKTTSELVRDDAKTPDDALKGRTSFFLGKNLRQLAHFVKETA